MNWTKYQCANFGLEHPIGWQVQFSPGPMTMVSSPAGDACAVIEAFPLGPGDTPAVILEKLRFPSARLYGEARPEMAVPGPAHSVSMFLNYRTRAGLAGRARLSCVQSGGLVSVFTSAALADRFAAYEPILVRILMSFRPAAMTGPVAAEPQPPQQPPGAGAMPYAQFTDPEQGSFTLEVPAGWKVRGGLKHPAMGDRRAWVEAQSPQGAHILNGDPEFPQYLCHFPANPEGVQIAVTGGTPLLNLAPSADRVADFYLKNILKNHLGAFEAQPRRPRPDFVAFMRAENTRQGVALDKHAQLLAVETLFQVNREGVRRVGSLITTAAFCGQYTMGMFAFWAGNVYLYIAPPELASQAEAVRWHMIQSYRDTPRMQQIVQRDEAMITQAGNAANAAQWNWFAGQQAAHQAQVAAGDAIMNNYWRQQQANDALLRGWKQNQAVNDQLSQARSDQILDRQRLADDAMGHSYEAPAGSNFYWLDQQTGQIVGTDTKDPPDLARNYTPLRRL